MTTKKTATRIYLVTDKQGSSTVAVRATNASQAVNFATRDRFSIRVATIEDALQMSLAKAQVLDATVPDVHPDQQPLTGV